MSIKRIGIIYYKDKKKAAEFAEKLGKFLKEKRKKFIINENINEIIAAKPDVIITLGGDGSMIHVANRISKEGKEIPILGINFGNRGFLTIAQNALEAYEKIERMLDGNYIITERTRIEAQIYKVDEESEKFSGLNEVVIERSGSEAISFEVVCDNKTESIIIEGDGVIIATKTGSSAYSRSAGGPILPRDDFIIMSISPTNRGEEPLYFIRATSSIFSIRELENRPRLVVDGKEIMKLSKDNTVIIRKSSIKTCFIEIGDREK